VTALVRYQLALLLRGQRWLPPLLLHAGVLVVGVRAGQPVLDALGYAAAPLVPVAAWWVRVCVTGEPEASRHCVAAAVGPGRAHLAALLAAVVVSLVSGVVSVVVVAVVSDPHTTGRAVEVPVWPAARAGLLATAACALLGTAVGVVCNRPVVGRRGWAVASTVLVALCALVVGGSPANAAVRGLVGGSRSGVVPVPWLPLAVASLVAVAAAASACFLAARRR
jgi:hypothetical protein